MLCAPRWAGYEPEGDPNTSLTGRAMRAGPVCHACGGEAHGVPRAFRGRGQHRASVGDCSYICLKIKHEQDILEELTN